MNFDDPYSFEPVSSSVIDSVATDYADGLTRSAVNVANHDNIDVGADWVP